MTTVHMIEETIRLGLGKLSQDGALIVETGAHTGRATKARYVVKRADVESTVDWGTVNQPLNASFADDFFARLTEKLSQNRTYQYHGFCGPYSITVQSLSPWHIAFAENMFRHAPVESIRSHLDKTPTIRVWHDPYGKVSDLGLSFESETLIALDPANMQVGIIGTAYAGEIKKSAFALSNYALPDYGIFPMHASANCKEDGSESSVLFGLSGTGKTTLSADPERALIGDDEIIWSPSGISNLEGGCYAKLINLEEAKEPEIYHAVNRFGAILENVGFDEATRRVDFSDAKKTENTRGSYSLQALAKPFDQYREASAPKTIIFLTADAFGAMPIVAKLDPWQARYHFMSGYTAKVAGTEIGVTEPQATFSACFGAPFMPRHPSVYAHLLADRAEQSGASIWILNTGWSHGGYGKGERFPIALSRQLLTNIQTGALDHVPMETHPIFRFSVPTSCPGVDPKWLAIPTGEAVTALAKRFMENIQKFSTIEHEIVEKGGPRIA